MHQSTLIRRHRKNVEYFFLVFVINDRNIRLLLISIEFQFQIFSDRILIEIRKLNVIAFAKMYNKKVKSFYQYWQRGRWLNLFIFLSAYTYKRRWIRREKRKFFEFQNVEIKSIDCNAEMLLLWEFYLFYLRSLTRVAVFGFVFILVDPIWWFPDCF